MLWLGFAMSWTMTVPPAPTAVMIHGAGGGGWEYVMWEPVFERAGYRVIARDLEPAAEGLARTTLDDYERQVEAWCREAEGPVVLIGASMGGILALRVAHRVGARAVVLINSVAPAGVGPVRERRTYPEIVRWADGPREETVEALPDATEEMIDFAWKRWRDESGRVLNELVAGVACLRPPGPTLVVLSEDDTDIPAATGQAIAAWAGADTFRYAGVSHVGPLLGRRANEIATQTLVWLERARERGLDSR